MLTTILLIALLICNIISIIFGIVLLIQYKQLSMFIQNQSNVLYHMDKRQRRSEIDIHEMNESIESLSTSVISIIKAYQQQSSTGIFPRPELVEQINATIADLLSIEVGLSKNMNASRRDSVPKIIETLCQTYPEVDKTYLSKKALSIIETYTSNEK